LALALAAPASAGINTEITGKVQTDLYYDQYDGFWAWGDVETKITMSAGTDGAVKAVLGLGANESNDEGKFGRDGDNASDSGSPLSRHTGISLKVDTAYIQADGAWIDGLPDVTTKVGRFGTNYSDWVANFGDRDGVELSNINFGPVSVAGLYAWVNNSPISSDAIARRSEFADDAARNAFIDSIKSKDWRIAAVKGSGSLDVVNLTGVYVRTYADDDENVTLNDYAVTASVAPIEGLKIDATFAGTNYEGLPAPIGDEKGTGWKVNAELSTIPNITLGATVWASDNEFNPVYTKLDDKKPTEFAGWDKPNERKGVEVRANTTQAGFDLGLKVKNTSDYDGTDASKATSYEFTASRQFGIVKGTYKYEDGDKKEYLHTITAETTVDTPIVKALNLKGTIRLPENKDLQYAADATWEAPNGFNVGLHYANYDRDDGWGGRDIGGDAQDGKADGFVVKIGKTITF